MMSFLNLARNRRVVTFLLAIFFLIALEIAFLLHRDLYQVSLSQSGLRKQHLVRAVDSFLMPKIALLFLVRGPMPLEPVWNLFFHAPRDPTLFSLYIHSSPDFAGYAQGSRFAGHEIPTRVHVEWGQHSVVEAERLLLKEALKDPDNLIFVFLSESCIPLYPDHAIYIQLMAEDRSRIHACTDAADPKDGEHRMDYRWHPNMQAIANITLADWRKSSQWVSLIRPHAEAIVDDIFVNEAFKKECYVEENEEDGGYSRFCPSDEHQFPTLLAHLHEAPGAVYCGGGLTHNAWDGPYYHPHTYREDEATEKTLMEVLREGARLEACHAGDLEMAAAVLNDVQSDSSDLTVKEKKRLIEDMFQESKMPPNCPLFARKIHGEGVGAWVHLLQPVLVSS